jgi:exodeoxyribonuclease V beta subunit
VGSFSSLTAHGDDERDLDASALAQAPAEGGDVRLADLPAGVAVGTALHGVLERIDFQDPVDLREQVAEAFADGSAPPEWIDEVVAALRDVLRTPLGPDGHRLCDIAASRRLVEMPFTLAIRADGFDPAALADVFARHGRTEMAQDLRGLGFPLIEGFLRGVVDLIYAHEGRFYVADHKSNHLGPRVADYGRARMDAAMRQHHYGLQAALYTVALHRHLRHRLRDYDPARHLGGIRYLFLRGMHPDHPPGTGVFIDRLPDALVADLDGLFHVRPR